MMLSKEQREVVENVVVHSQSVFITGSAGTGKSLVLRRIIRDLQSKGEAPHLFVTAPTGIR
jgi:ATP-dependent DNA helicase PIF1